MCVQLRCVYAFLILFDFDVKYFDIHFTQSTSKVCKQQCDSIAANLPIISTAQSQSDQVTLVTAGYFNWTMSPRPGKLIY